MVAQKRGKNVAIAGAAGQIILAAVLLGIWMWSDSLAAFACMLLSLGGLGVWLMVAFLCYTRQLAQLEEDQMRDLAAHGATTGTIFETAEGVELRPAAARVAFANRWLVPAFTLLWAAFDVAIGILLIRYLADRSPADIVHAKESMLLVVVVGFGAFLLSRYVTGMAKASDWRLLRAPGSYLLVNVIFVAALLGCLVCAWQGNMRIDFYLAFAVPIMQFVLAAEMMMNFTLDLYRPRVPGAEHRPSFDSRLCNFIAEPERVGHSIAEALNYQFGFEVSKTWFYQLLSKAFVPLVVVAVLAMFAMSSIVIVRHGEQYVVLHWGKADPDKATLGPGIHFKWPWPIDTARRFETGKVHEIMLGVGKEREPVLIKGRELYLWTEEHGSRKELDFLLAVPPKSRMKTLQKGKTPPPPVNIIKLVVCLQYTISEPYKFGYNYGYMYTGSDKGEKKTDGASKLLEDIAYREMSSYCASATLDTPLPGESDRPEAIMTYGRQRAAAELKKRIQARADELDLGVKIEYVGLGAVHPPAEAAPAYEAVLEAERRMLLTRYEAEADAKKVLVEVAGSASAAMELSLAIQTMEDLEKLRERPADAESIYESLLGRANEHLESLSKEIADERLLGQISTSELTDAQQLHQAYRQYVALLKDIRSGKESLDEQIVAARRRVDGLFAQTVGEPAKVVAEAEAYRWSQELAERARAQSFQRELLAYRASPNMYMLDRWLDVWDEVLPSVKKYVIGVDRDKLEIWMNLERQPSGMEGAYEDQPTN